VLKCQCSLTREIGRIHAENKQFLLVIFDQGCEYILGCFDEGVSQTGPSDGWLNSWY
jgi:hypothetical protein